MGLHSATRIWRPRSAPGVLTSETAAAFVICSRDAMAAPAADEESFAC